MGPSGSGKSTLFNMIGGLDMPTRGRVSVMGVEISSLPSRVAARLRCRHIGYIFQAYNLIPVLTALDNVGLPALLLGLSQEEARERAEQQRAAVAKPWCQSRCPVKPGSSDGLSRRFVGTLYRRCGRYQEKISFFPQIRGLRRRIGNFGWRVSARRVATFVLQTRRPLWGGVGHG